MKVNIYYGGRGLVEDSTIYTINKITEVLKEIRVEVTRYNLYEEKNSINMLPKTLKEADGIILATSVEWMGIGGFMQQFLDACWFYADKENLKKQYMMPVVMATTYGEKEAERTLIKSWELLGGIACDGLCAYVEDYVEFETNPDYGIIIERKAEDLYRTINQKAKRLPSSDNSIKRNNTRNSALLLTPQENEQLSAYVSDDIYVKKQKEDIDELTQIFKDMLGSKKLDSTKEYVQELTECFRPMEECIATYLISIADTGKNLVVEVDHDKLKCYYGDKEDTDINIRVERAVLNNLIKGKVTIQKAFMSGELTAKGDFKVLQIFDQVFPFNLQ